MNYDILNMVMNAFGLTIDEAEKRYGVPEFTDYDREAPLLRGFFRAWYFVTIITVSKDMLLIGGM